MEDGSSVRIKVAQYFINKKIQELESKEAKLEIDDHVDLLQTLPKALARIQDGVEAPAPGPDEPSPIFLPAPGDRDVPWKLVLDSYIDHQPTPEEGIIQLRIPPWYRVAIIGAGVAGLRTAMLLQSKGIPYKIFEASDRPGGRIFTYQFAPGSSPGKHDYYDVGAMRFPENDANKETFKLFKELDLSTIEYVMSNDENIRYYNNIKSTAAVARTKGDHFNDGVTRGGIVPTEYVEKEHTNLRGKKVFGVNACTAAAYDPFRKLLIEDFKKGWEELMKYDWASTRSYLTQGQPKYPLSVVHWMESMNSGTGGFDRAFSEAILDSLEFDDPTKDVKWRCLEGGSKVLIDAMVERLKVEPVYNHRVTSVEMHVITLPKCFPDFDRWPDWARLRQFPMMKVNVSGKEEAEYFTHVISTSSFANLCTIDTDKVLMTYKQRQAIRTLNYGPAVKVGIKFKSRWWERTDLNQRGGASYTDRQSRVVVYPSYGLGEEGPGVLMVTYNWHQDASRFGALIKNPDWSEKLDPGRKRPPSEQVLLEQIYKDLATLHGVEVTYLQEQTLDYHPFFWYQNPYTMGAFAHFAPGQFSTFFDDIVIPASYGRFHFAGEVASHHHAWVAGALDSANRVVNEILRLDFPIMIHKYEMDHGRSLIFSDKKVAEAHFVRGLFSRELERAGFD